MLLHSGSVSLWWHSHRVSHDASSLLNTLWKVLVIGRNGVRSKKDISFLFLNFYVRCYLCERAQCVLVITCFARSKDKPKELIPSLCPAGSGIKVGNALTIWAILSVLFLNLDILILALHSFRLPYGFSAQPLLWLILFAPSPGLLPLPFQVPSLCHYFSCVPILSSSKHPPTPHELLLVSWLLQGAPS